MQGEEGLEDPSVLVAAGRLTQHLGEKALDQLEPKLGNEDEDICVPGWEGQTLTPHRQNQFSQFLFVCV